MAAKHNVLLQEHYLREVLRSILKIRRLLQPSDGRTSLAADQLELKRLFDNIRDLSMVHGYEATEKIVMKISSRLEHNISNNLPVSRLLAIKIRRTLSILREVTKLEEQLEGRTSVVRIDRDLGTFSEKAGDANQEGREALIASDESGKEDSENGILIKVVDEEAEGLMPFILSEEFSSVVAVNDDFETVDASQEQM